MQKFTLDTQWTVDSLVYNFGSITTGSATGGYEVVVTFQAMMVTTDLTDPTSYITTGASLDAENFVYIGQHEIDTSDRSDPGSTSTAFLVNPPDSSVPAGDSVLLEIDAWITHPSSEVFFDILGPNFEQDVFSVGGISVHVVNAGSSYFECSPFENTDQYSYQRSLTGLSLTEARLRIPLVNNFGEGDGFAVPDNSKVKFLVPVYVMPGVEVGTLISIGLSMTVATEVFAHIHNITVNGDTPASYSPVTAGTATLTPISELTVGPHGVVTFLLTVPITGPGKLESLVITSTGGSEYEPAGIRFARADPNIQYIPPVDNSSVTLSSPELTLSLTNIINTNAHANGGDSLTFEISFHDVGTLSTTTHNIVVDVNGQSVPGNFTVDVDLQTATPSGALAVAQDDGNWYVGSSVAIDIIITIPGGAYVEDMVINMVGELPGVFQYPVRVCRAEMSHVGTGIPAFINTQPYLNQEWIYYTNGSESLTPPMVDAATLSAGTAAGASRTGIYANESSNIVIFNGVFELPPHDAIMDAEIYSLSAGADLQPLLVWAGYANFTVSTTPPAWNTTLPTPVMYIKNFSDTATPVGHLNRMDVIFKLPPGAVAPVKLVIVSDDSNMFAICSIKITYIGHNYPCVDPDPAGKYDQWQTTQFLYNKVDPLDPAKMNLDATAEFFVLRNVGTYPFIETEVRDPNTIIVSVVGLVIAQGGGITASLNYGDAAPVVASGLINDAPAAPVINIPTQEAAMTRQQVAHNASSPKAATLKRDELEMALVRPGEGDYRCDYKGVTLADETSWTQPNYDGFVRRRPKIMRLVLPITEGFATSNLTVEFFDDTAQSFNVCCAGVVFAGENLPCLNSTGTMLDRLETIDVTTNFTNYNSISLVIGPACHSILSSDPTQNELHVDVAFTVPETSTAPVTINAKVYVDGVVTITSSTTVDEYVGGDDVPENYPYDNSNTGEAILPVPSIAGEVGVKYWVTANLTIPKGASFSMEPTAFGGTADTDVRARVTFSDMRVVSAGRNIACGTDIQRYVTNYTSTENITHESQKDLLEVDVKIENTGWSYIFGEEDPTIDDHLVMEFEFMVTDHPENTAGSIVPVLLGFKMGSIVYVLSHNVTVGRPNNEDIWISSDIEVSPTTQPIDGVFQQGSRVEFGVTLEHLPSSRRECKETHLRILIPPYMEHVMNEDTCDVNATFLWSCNYTADGYLDIMFDYFLFTDEVIVNFSLTVNPNSVRTPDGISPLNATAMTSLVCLMDSLADDSTTLFFPAAADAANFQFCGISDAVDYPVPSNLCEPVALGMESGAIPDCQLFASSAIDFTHGPQNARLNNPNGWSPSMYGLTSAQKAYPFHTTDLGNVTRVFGVTVGSPGENHVTNFKIFYSFDGDVFIDTGEAETPTAMPFHKNFTNPVQAKFIRIVIYDVKFKENFVDPVKVTLEWHGCVLGTLAPPGCPTSTPLKTRYTDDRTQWTHFVVDDPTADDPLTVVHFCVFNEIRQAMNCYHSDDDGLTWRQSPAYVGYIEGYDIAEGRVLARDSNNWSFLASRDGIKWTPLTETAYTAIKEGGSTVFKPSLGIAAVDDPSNVKTDGIWKGDYQGLKMNDVMKVRWSSCCGS
ncbi:unnamed protein product [Cyprideis torosa]|uniref:Uncharacterized protein n=1 Tax=Cyprideis torosa TaxID=163714 RepID=A0A7R8ZNF3_9CRUS|nr:unnamed protein product [Cyprideis torosa]CAG0886205.1 unnamed protein product [Cyprideis torosa]